VITYEQVVPSASISGSLTGLGYSSGVTQTINGQGSTEGATFDWFGGVIQGSGKFDRTDFAFVLDDAQDEIINDDGPNSFTFLTFTFNKEYSYRSGITTEEFYTRGLTLVNGPDGGQTVGSPALVVSESPQDPSWSVSDVELQTYEEIVLNDQPGTISVVTESQEQVISTALVGDKTETVFVERAATKLTTSLINSSTRATWVAAPYAAFFVTGQTTAKVFRQFANEIPAVWEEAIMTKSSAVEPLSFVTINGYSNTQNLTLATFSATNVVAASTRTTLGASVQLDAMARNPRVVPGGTKASTTNSAFFLVDEAVDETDRETVNQFVKSEINVRRRTIKSLNFVDNSIAAQYALTVTAEIAPPGYVSSESFAEGSSTQSGFYEIQATNVLQTQRPASIVAVSHETVGVRAAPDEAAGGGVEEDGQNNAFFPHTAAIYLPGAAVAQDSVQTTIYSLNSYTIKNKNGDDVMGQFAATGEAQEQFKTAAPVQSNVASATVLGGPIAGQAIIHTGAYSTFAGAESGIANITDPFAAVWAASAATSAWLPAFQVETVGAVNAVVAVSRHSFTQVIDD
jgi:hypothetical protein